MGDLLGRPRAALGEAAKQRLGEPGQLTCQEPGASLPRPRQYL